MNEPLIKVMIVDDHPVVRAGIADILGLEDDIVVIAEAADGQEAIEKVKKHNPDLVLMDMQMPNMGGVEAINSIREFNKQVKFIILTTYKNEDFVFDGVNAGARGYLLKDAEPDELIDAIQRVYRGESLIDSSMITKVLDRFSLITSSKSRAHNLTNREVEVLELIANGASNKDIAAALFISEKTVKTHITHIFKKLQVNDRTKAVTKAIRRHIIKI